MDITSPFLPQMLTNEPIRVDGITYYLHGTKVLACKSKRSPSESRSEGEETVVFPAEGQPEGTPLHLYLFFGNEKQDRFSPSEYVEV